MKKIMILTAERTGNGHKSASNAIEKRLKDLGYETMQIDCFETMGKLGMKLENAYIPVTTKKPFIFYISFMFSQIFTDFLHFLIYLKCKKSFKEEIEKYNPDLILSVHPMFTNAITRLLKKEHKKIPFYINIIDLVKPPRTWFDKNADIFFVPSDEVKQSYIKKGIDAEKIIVFVFPIRDDIERRKTPKKVGEKVNILLVNPSVNLKKNIKFAKEVSKIENTNVKVICGRDEKMYNSLINEQNNGNIPKSTEIYSFVTNMNEYLDESHILLTKAGPNMILEGARSGTAIVVTGHIQGQENRNYEYVEKNGFGFKCEDPYLIYNKLNNFINNKNLEDCLNNVISSDCNDGAKIIADFINVNI